MIDTRGLSCPTPVIMVQKALREGAALPLEVLSDSRVSVENITRFAHSQGCQVTEAAEGADFKLTLRKKKSGGGRIVPPPVTFTFPPKRAHPKFCPVRGRWPDSPR